MAFFQSAVGVLQTLVIALGAGLGIWGVQIKRRLPSRAMMGIDSCGMLISAVHNENVDVENVMNT